MIPFGVLHWQQWQPPTSTPGHLDLAINDRDIDRTNRKESPRNDGEKPRPKIIKFVR